MREVSLLLPWLLAGLVCAVWILPSAFFSAAHGLALLLWLSGAWLVHAELRRPNQGLLVWDGQSWIWEAGGRRCLGVPHLRLDWQQGLLLEFRPAEGRRVWLWIERGMAPGTWDGLRRALYAPSVATLAVEGAGP